MSKKEYFPPRQSTNPTINSYELPEITYKKALLKIVQSDLAPGIDPLVIKISIF